MTLDGTGALLDSHLPGQPEDEATPLCSDWLEGFITIIVSTNTVIGCWFICCTLTIRSTNLFGFGWTDKINIISEVILHHNVVNML